MRQKLSMLETNLFYKYVFLNLTKANFYEEWKKVRHGREATFI